MFAWMSYQKKSATVVRKGRELQVDEQRTNTSKLHRFLREMKDRIMLEYTASDGTRVAGLVAEIVKR